MRGRIGNEGIFKKTRFQDIMDGDRQTMSVGETTSEHA
jgi:hypothetical protein